MKAFCLDNLSEHAVVKREPWGLPPTSFSYPTQGFASSAEYKKWACTRGTKYCAFNLVEGEVPTQRLGETNEPKRIFGLVADFDTNTPYSDNEIVEFVARSINSDHPMACFSRSFRGGVHAVWFFEEPVACLGKVSASQFLREANKALGLKQLLRGWDEACSEKPEQYYLYGRDWQNVSNHTIPSAVCHAWMHSATNSNTFKEYGTKIPLAEVFTEVEKQFPQHGWVGEFKEGSRGSTFFDPHGGHRSANSAIVRETGMQVFNMEKGFYSWAEVLGQAFVKKYQTSRVGNAVKDFFYDGKNYYEKLSNEEYFARNRKDVEVVLKARHGLSTKVARGASSSEVDDAFNTILNNKIVHGAMPFVYDKRQVINFQGKRYLNTATRRVCRPAEDPQAWCDNFPFIGSLLEGLLGAQQLPYWLAWASRFYKACHTGRPNQGHAVFLIGDTGLGKTLINENILDVVFNGTAACGRFLMGEDNGFNAHLFEFGLWTCDDRVPASDRKKHQHYTSTVKSIVANGVFNVEQKYMKTGQIVWNGRLCVTANYTTEDIRMIPELNISMRDKILLFKAKNHCVQFSDRKTNRELCEKEAPFFSRYLLDYTPPPEVKINARFGFDGYIDKTLENFSLDNSPHAYILEIVELFNDRFFSKDGVPQWEGTGTALLQELGTLEGSNQFLKGVDAQRLGFSLTHYMNKGVDWLDKKGRKWVLKNPNIKS